VIVVMGIAFLGWRMTFCIVHQRRVDL